MAEKLRKRSTLRHTPGTAGFTIIELCVVMVVILVLSSFAAPGFVNMLHSYRLSGAVTDFASLVQVQRLRAVDDDRFYSSYVVTSSNGAQLAFVDIYPQNVNGSSGTLGTTYTCSGGNCDPDVTVSSEIAQQSAANAPNTAALKSAFLPASSPVTPQDGFSSSTPVTFGPTGLPCTPVAVTGGTVCDSSGGATAYWTFFQNSASQSWGAVTITPAGRIQRWLYSGGGSNGTWANY